MAKGAAERKRRFLELGADPFGRPQQRRKDPVGGELAVLRVFNAGMHTE